MIVSNDVAIDRASICAGCEFLFKPTWTCKKCGCFMKVKVRLSSSSCPIGKWDSTQNEIEE